MKIVTRTQAIAGGLSVYFTGQPCKRKHVAGRSTKHGYCTVCRNEARAANYRNAKGKRWWPN